MAIIGPRGSGKTALADFIAVGAGAYDDGPASFIGKAGRMLGSTTVQLGWERNGVSPPRRAFGASQEQEPQVLYLSQHFVESLCSAAGESDRLVTEMEQVIFSQIDLLDRLETNSLGELRVLRTQPMAEEVSAAQKEIQRLSELIQVEVQNLKSVKALETKIGTCSSELSDLEKQFAAIVVGNEAAKVQLLQKLQHELNDLETVAARLNLRLTNVRDLRRSLSAREEELARESIALRAELIEIGIAKDSTNVFETTFKGDWRAVLLDLEKNLQHQFGKVRNGEPGVSNRCVASVKAEVELLQKDMNADATQRAKSKNLSSLIATKHREIEQMQKQKTLAEGARNRIPEHQAVRIEQYRKVLASLNEESDILFELYAPLRLQLSALNDNRKRLEFGVRRIVDIQKWVSRGLSLFDGRWADSPTRADLEHIADSILLPVWRGLQDQDISNAIRRVLEHDKLKDFDKTLNSTSSPGAVAEWLFSTDHVRIAYSIRYEGVDIDKLSPGARGAVLLMLYLALDATDNRPVVIDQPEENLDPRSVFTELVPYFRGARTRRQVILVTHNPNLVVNADVDQVVVASADRHGAGLLPRFSYIAGGLEEPAIRERVCEILEGGREAFLKRERRYELRHK